MSEKEFKQYLREIKAHHLDIRSTREKAIKFMQDTGILDKDGKLSKNYK